MTELLYLPNADAAYERRFSARVTALPPGGAVLDRTLFYPTGGGQPCDLGVLAASDGSEWGVADVAKSGPAVVHRLARRGSTRSTLSIGSEVTGTIDWERRYRHMRAHTFQHLLSARVFVLSGRRTRRASLSASGGHVDVEGPWPAAVAWADVDADVRAHLDLALPVNVRMIPRAAYEAAPGDRSGLVPLPPHVDPVRLVEIEEADRCPCGGTHVRSTSEVGSYRLAAPQAMGGGDVRVAFTLTAGGPPTPTA